MSEYKQKIIEAMESCLVNDEEWNKMLATNLSQNFKEDPFKTYGIERQNEDTDSEDGDEEVPQLVK